MSPHTSCALLALQDGFRHTAKSVGFKIHALTGLGKTNVCDGLVDLQWACFESLFQLQGGVDMSGFMHIKT